VKSLGYVGLTATAAEAARRAGTLPPRAVVVTLDDGYASTRLAAPILAELGFPGTVSVVTEFMESSEALRAGVAEWHQPDTIDELRPLTQSDAEALIGRGWKMGSHTATHPLLTTSDDAALHAELSDSRPTIETRLGSCPSTAYPRSRGRARGGRSTSHRLRRRLHADVRPDRRRADASSPRLPRPRDHGMCLKSMVSDAGLSARRSRLARVARKVHFRRSWLPDA